MKFQTPKTKDLITVGKGLLAFEGGKRVGRGVAGLTTDNNDPQRRDLIKGGLAVTAVVAAAAYKGGNADIVIPALVGLAAEQAGDLIDAQAAKSITVNPTPSQPQKFLQHAMGLGCDCNGGMRAISFEDQPYAMLANPAIREIEWQEVWDGHDDNNYAGA